MRNNKNGFTKIELIIFISVIILESLIHISVFFVINAKKKMNYSNEKVESVYNEIAKNTVKEYFKGLVFVCECDSGYNDYYYIVDNQGNLSQANKCDYIHSNLHNEGIKSTIKTKNGNSIILKDPNESEHTLSDLLLDENYKNGYNGVYIYYGTDKNGYLYTSEYGNNDETQNEIVRQSSAIQKATNAFKEYYAKIVVDVNDEIDGTADLKGYIIIVDNGTGLSDYLFRINDVGQLKYIAKVNYTKGEYNASGVATTASTMYNVVRPNEPTPAAAEIVNFKDANNTDTTIGAANIRLEVKYAVEGVDIYYGTEAMGYKQAAR